MSSDAAVSTVVSSIITTMVTPPLVSKGPLAVSAVARGSPATIGFPAGAY